MKIISTLIFLMLILNDINSVSEAAEIYKWIDENGVVHFGDRPGNSRTEKIDIEDSGNFLSVDPELEKHRQKQNRLLDRMEEERKMNEEDRAKRKEQQKKLNKTCMEAKDYKKNMKLAGRIYRLDDQGNRVFYSNEERKNYEKKVNDLISKYCK